MTDPKPRTRARRIRVPVTAEIIAESVRSNSAHCMIAEALKAAIPTASHVTVDLATIRFTDRKRGERYIYLTPPAAQVALLQYDLGETPDPFDLKAYPAQIVPMGGHHKPKTEPAEPVESTPAEPAPRKSRKRATTEPTRGSGARAVPVKIGGTPPPLGALAGGTTGAPAAALKTGRVRRHGLRVMGHNSHTRGEPSR